LYSLSVWMFLSVDICVIEFVVCWFAAWIRYR
jgi:hypothetical protein